MASSSGTSSGSSLLQNSGSEEELQALMDERKRKRMISNRESARRSRLRKQKHLGDLMAKIALLRKENNEIMASVRVTNEHYMKIEAENSVLNAQVIELSQRLQSLNEIISFFDACNGGISNEGFDGFVNPWNLMCINQQPIMASVDMLHY